MPDNFVSEDISKPQFPAKRIAEVSGASAADLQNWANRKLIGFDRGSPGKGGLRLYSKLQALNIISARQLMAHGIEAAVAFEIGAQCVSSLLRDIDTQSHEWLRSRHDEDVDSVALIFKGKRGNWEVIYEDDGLRDVSLDLFLENTVSGSVLIVLRYRPLRQALLELSIASTKTTSAKKASRKATKKTSRRGARK